jgi:hypothetical protein
MRFGDLLLHTLMGSCPVEVVHIRDFAHAGAASRERSTGGPGILVVHSLKIVRRSHWRGEHDTVF